MNRGIEALQSLLRKVKYKDGWSFRLVPIRQTVIGFEDDIPSTMMLDVFQAPEEQGKYGQPFTVIVAGYCISC